MRHINIFALALAAATITACQQEEVLDISRIQGKATAELSGATRAKMQSLGMDAKSPIMIRIFKEEGVMEVWKSKADGRFALLKSYPICAWSGMLGPKKKEGDRQAPEGFYDITPAQMNPNSRYYLAFNIGFPNNYDRSLGRSGANLMIHGACSSSGCYSMTDAQVREIFALAHDAFDGGQRAFQIQALPFRMTAENMARHQNNANFDFWKMLKVGYDHFEITHRPPDVAVCNHTYVFNQKATDGKAFSPSAACPAMTMPADMAQAYAAYSSGYDKQYAEAQKKYSGYVWAEPSEADRKAVVAKLKAKSSDLAFAPTGNGLQAGKMIRIDQFEAEQHKVQQTEADKALADAAVKAVQKTKRLPVPQASPASPLQAATAAAPVETAQQDAGGAGKPFWKFWGN